MDPENAAALFFNSQSSGSEAATAWGLDLGGGATNRPSQLRVLRTAGYQVPHQVLEAIRSLLLAATFPGVGAEVSKEKNNIYDESLEA